MVVDGSIRTLRDPSSVYAGRQAYWVPIRETSDDDLVLNEKIKSAFRGVKSFPFKRIYFQFWRTIAEGERLVLECYRNPFAHPPFDRRLLKYRTRSIKYLYSIVNDDDDDVEGDNNNNNIDNNINSPNTCLPARIITGGLAAAAFLNHFPEVAVDLRVHQGSPLVDCGLDCELTCCMMLPVFDDSSSSKCRPRGVVECCMTHPGRLLVIFNELKRELERKGLNIYHLQGSWPYKTITGDLEPAKIEIEKGLRMACESHDLTLGQVWIDHHAPRRCLVKLRAYHHVAADRVSDFYDKLDVLFGEGLALKTLQTHQPYFCKNMYKLSEEELENRRGLLGLLSTNAKKSSTCFVICLRSTHTGELDYAFEFFWPQSRHHLILLETLLLTLRKCLPSFKFASGEHLGDEIYVVDASSGRPVKILQANELSETSKPLRVKRKSIYMYSDQCDLNQSNQHALNNINSPEGEDEEDDLAILAIYRNEVASFFLPISSSTHENLMVKLNMEFELDPAVEYKVEHEVLPGQWCFLESLESCRLRIKRSGVIKLRLVAVNGEVGWRWKTQT